MNAPFPFGFPGATAFYLTLYVVTLLIHVAFMNYVLAGATCLVFGLGRGRAGSATTTGAPSIRTATSSCWPPDTAPPPATRCG